MILDMGISSEAGSLRVQPLARKRPLRPRLTLDRVRHRLRGVDFVVSPNCDARPELADISLLVVHAISLPPGKYGGPWISRLFTNRLDPKAHPYFRGIQHLKVSAHVCIFRDGAITQYVPFHRRAWHAGESVYRGRTRCNDFSIGVELEGCDAQPFEDAQYHILARLARVLLRAYPGLKPARIVGHSDIAPGRKTDPGPCFDWSRFRSELALTQ